MKAADLLDLDTEELYVRLAETKEELFNLRFRLATGQLDDYKRLKVVKKDVARLQTVIRDREISAYEEQAEQAASGSAAQSAEVEA